MNPDGTYQIHDIEHAYDIAVDARGCAHKALEIASTTKTLRRWKQAVARVAHTRDDLAFARAHQARRPITTQDYTRYPRTP